MIRGVAQLGSALRSGRRGRGFKSRHPDRVVDEIVFCRDAILSNSEVLMASVRLFDSFCVEFLLISWQGGDPKRTIFPDCARRR